MLSLELRVKFRAFKSHLFNYKPSRYKGKALRLWLNSRGVTTVSRKYSLTVARHATVVVTVPSTVHYLANYKIKIHYLR
jgi:hypothetical protein